MPQSKIESKIEEKLKDVPDTTNMINEFVDMLYGIDSEKVPEYLRTFKSMYSEESYYPHIIPSIIEQVDMNCLAEEKLAEDCLG